MRSRQSLSIPSAAHLLAASLVCVASSGGQPVRHGALFPTKLHLLRKQTRTRRPTALTVTAAHTSSCSSFPSLVSHDLTSSAEQQHLGHPIAHHLNFDLNLLRPKPTFQQPPASASVQESRCRTKTLRRATQTRARRCRNQ